MLSENKVTTYLLYAIGEIVLVVVGILIAVSIDDWNNERQEKKEQELYYKGILVDLRKDSVHFASRIKSFQRNLDLYYDIYDQIRGVYAKEQLPFYDPLLYNTNFFSITQQNQQQVIEKLQNTEIRDQLNNYFQQYLQVVDATNEFNDTVIEDARPFFLKSNVIQHRAVFHDEKYGFLPKEPMLDQKQVAILTSDPKTFEILASLRISSGYALVSLISLSEVNQQLITALETELQLSANPLQ
ncbi:MAG: hypothetical protein HRT61_13050 [Ekhidna sp.]|nr:hypothetical protein [Ekhidna sp.]